MIEINQLRLSAPPPRGAQPHRLSPMRHVSSIFVGLVLVLGVPGIAVATAQSWAFVVSVGGIVIGDAVKANGTWSLPVRADVSGLESFTSKPTVMNSAMVCSGVVAKIVRSDIYLTIHTDLAGVGKRAQCPAAKLGVLPVGAYTVFYQGPEDAPVRLRAVQVGH
jgi:hypothetical protein